MNDLIFVFFQAAEKTVKAFDVISLIFVIFFLIELCLRIFVEM